MKKENIDTVLESRRCFIRTNLGGVLVGAVTLGIASSAFAESCHINLHENTFYDDEANPHTDSHTDLIGTHTNHPNHNDSGYQDHDDVGHTNSHTNHDDCPSGHSDSHNDQPAHSNHDNSHTNQNPHEDSCG